MQRIVRVGAAALVLVSLPCAARAQDNPQSAVQVLPPIVVSATTIPTPANEVANSVTVITADDIKREQIRTVPDALRTVPGLNVVQTGGPGGQTAVFIRGTNSNHVKVLLDGIDMGDPSVTTGAFDFAHLLTGDIERIEVLRGPQSGLYGSDAIGGVISITTKKGEGPPKATATLEGGSFGTFNQTAALSGAQANVNYAFNILHYQSTSNPVTPLDLLAPGEKRINDSYNNWTYSAKLGAKLGEDVEVNYVARYIDSRLGFTGEDYLNFFPPAPEQFQSTQRNHQFFTRGEVVWSLFGGKFKNYLGVNYSNQWTWIFDPNADSFFTSPLVSPPTTNVGERTKFGWRSVAQVAPGQTLVMGLEREHEALRTGSTGTVDAFYNYTQTTTSADTGDTAGYLELQSEFAKRLFLVANLRYDNNDSFGPHVTWRVAPAVIVPGTETKLKASYGTGFKAPTLTQLYVSNPSYMVAGNPNLLPEESKGYDFGFEQPLWHDRVRFGATYFHNDITNLIVNTFDPVGFAFTYVNVGEAKMEGVESFASVAVTDQLKLRADYTATFTRDETTDLGLLRRPGNKASLTAIWSPLDQLTLTATLLYVGSWVDISRDGSIPRIAAPAYATVNIAADYRLDPHVTVFGRIDNLLNRQYEVPIGFDRPGFGIFGGVRLNK
jgi:vitamin B12 transporter